MNFRTTTQLFNLRDVRRAALGFVVVVGGIGLAALTLFAHRAEMPRLAGIAAGLSLLFVVLILIFVVPPLARNASKEASQMNLPFEFTTGGAIIIVLIVIVGFSAWNTGNNLLFLVLSFLTAAMAVGFIAGVVCLKKLDVKMRFPETIFAGEETPILVSIHNRKRLFPSISVIAEVRGNEREESVAAADLRKIFPSFIAEKLSRPPLVSRTLDYFVYVSRNQTSESKTTHVFPFRGRFLIKDFELSTKFPFAFFRHRRRLSAMETEMMIFPKLEPVDDELENLPLESGKLAANKRGSGQDLLALRDYQPNDDLRRIDWKATARSRHLIVREFSAEDDKKITVFLDSRMPGTDVPGITISEKLHLESMGTGGFRSERFERGVSITASLITRFTEDQAEIRLVIDGNAGEFGVGYRHLHSCLKRLAVIEPSFISTNTEFIPPETSQYFEARENSHNFLLSSSDVNQFESDFVQNTYILRF